MRCFIVPIAAGWGPNKTRVERPVSLTFDNAKRVKHNQREGKDPELHLTSIIVGWRALSQALPVYRDPSAHPHW